MPLPFSSFIKLAYIIYIPQQNILYTAEVFIGEFKIFQYSML
jgi:hypothetical protein